MKTEKRILVKNIHGVNIGSTKKTLIVSRKKYILSAVMLLSTLPTFAIAGKIGGWAGQIEAGFNAAVGLFTVVGAFIVFMQYMQGNEQAQKNLVKYVIGLAVFGLAGTLGGMFGIGGGS